ncbi:MAG: hypothetical protein LBD16_03710 [Oscillospiraceae bacterium]|jgi:hypothetical protein|nr:hypothetical protein [Oscillospiraceae bacterium]
MKRNYNSQSFAPDPLARLTREALFARITPEVAAQARAALYQIEQQEEIPVKKKLYIQPVLAAVIIIILCGAALAAVTWNAREFLFPTETLNAPVEKGGEPIKPNETLLSLAQPIAKTFEGDYLALDVADAINDGRSVILTWTARNKSSESLYYVYNIRYNGNYGGSGMSRNADEGFIGPNESLSSGVSSMLDFAAEETNVCEVTMSVTVLRPLFDTIHINDARDDLSNEEFNAQIDKMIASGIIPVAGDGLIETGSQFYDKPEMTNIERLIASGMAEIVETVDATLSLAANAEPIAVVIDGGQSAKDNGSYVLSVAKAAITPNTAEFLIDVLFPNREAYEQYLPYYAGKFAPIYSFEFLDETGNWSSWANNIGGGFTTDEPIEQPDGSWLWQYSATSTQLVRIPRAIDIIPRRADVQSGELISYPEEGITVVFDTDK